MLNIRKLLFESIWVKLKLVKSAADIQLIEEIGKVMVTTLASGRQIMIAGNGGSAADAQHFAAELSGKFINANRRPLPVTALSTNTSVLTAIGNDFSFNEVFSRQIDGQGRPGDIFIAITTSGNSQNILWALQAAHRKGLITIGLLGNDGGKARELCDLPLIVPSANTQNIQEAHISIIHILCAIVDEAFAAPK
ncbi:MAG TPA: SIS domain-containing protein [Candidatus Paceibacterota bacterium]|nr:SIS domain-containing protein [Candidatus Paceibacterota bacterium]